MPFFLQLLQLRKALPVNWRDKIINEFAPLKNFPTIIVFDINTSSFKNIINISSREFYWILWKHHRLKVSPAAINKWNEIFDITDDDWKCIFKTPFYTFKGTFFQYFQYKVLHRIIPCRHWLYNLKVINTPNCNYCGNDDTIVHFFFHCPVLKQFWTSYGKWWCKLMNRTEEINDSIVIFGVKIDCDEAITFNYCLTVAKYYIYINRLNDTKLFDFYKFLSFLKIKLNEECVYYLEQNDLQTFSRTRGPVFDNI